MHPPPSPLPTPLLLLQGVGFVGMFPFVTFLCNFPSFLESLTEAGGRACTTRASFLPASTYNHLRALIDTCAPPPPLLPTSYPRFLPPSASRLPKEASYSCEESLCTLNPASLEASWLLQLSYSDFSLGWTAGSTRVGAGSTSVSFLSKWSDFHEPNDL